MFQKLEAHNLTNNSPLAPSQCEVQGPDLLGETKYGPGPEPQWKAGRTQYPAFYKALLEEHSRTKRREMLVADQQSTRIQ